MQSNRGIAAQGIRSRRELIVQKLAIRRDCVSEVGCELTFDTVEPCLLRIDGGLAELGDDLARVIDFGGLERGAMSKLRGRSLKSVLSRILVLQART